MVCTHVLRLVGGMYVSVCIALWAMMLRWGAPEVAGLVLEIGCMLGLLSEAAAHLVAEQFYGSVHTLIDRYICT